MGWGEPHKVTGSSDRGSGSSRSDRGSGRASSDREPFKRGRTQEDVEDEKLRARLAGLLAAAGIDIRRVEQEVLFWLPSEFVRKYRELSESALDMAGPAAGGMGQGGSAGAGKALGAPSGDYARGTRRLSEGEGLKAHGGGKKYRSPAVVVKNERALALKQRVDRKLARLIETASDELRAIETGQARRDRCSECGRLTAKGRTGRREE